MRLRRNNHALPFPPGPKAFPIIGNFFDVPNEKSWETFSKWQKQYGDIISIELLGRRIVILNSSKHAIELLEKRSLKSANRPNFLLAGEMIGWKNTLVMSQYVHRVIGTRSILEPYYHHVEHQGYRFLNRLLDTPDDFAEHVRWMAGAIILVISHGYEVQDRRRSQKRDTWQLKEMTDKPYETVKAQLAEGTASAILHCRAKCSSFLMTLYPEVQRKAQAEIDAVVGSDRLPTIQDREQLPYISALVLELLRWFVIVPLGITHVTTEDDVYEGYWIPKGTYIFPNMWKMMHDPEVYPDPFLFKPERFAPGEGQAPEADPHNGIFGFGRR
ncbi:cytochrome P450 [Melanogaster broomeanus]|nr:cytochrome P450 [Melanogaster broomeanus]